ncbi:MAG: FecR domain-containing protein [Candidatus Riflebacteria bacterium]|nr:FecR domain-containing protein [Candidatus Riflebacteria bacterium]
MDCKRCNELLDDGGDNFVSQEERKTFHEHCQTCLKCQAVCASQNKIKQAYGQICPGSEQLTAFNERLFKRLGDVQTSPFSRSNKIIPIILAIIAFCIALAVVVSHQKVANDGEIPRAVPASVPQTPRPSPDVIAYVSGSKLIFKSAAEDVARLNVRDFPVPSGAKIEVGRDDSCMIRFADASEIQIKGRSRFAIQENTLALIEGSAVYSFNKLHSVLRVQMPMAILGIRGTVLHIVNRPDEDQVWVENGSITWSHLTSGKNGILNVKTGLRFSETIVALSCSPLDAVVKMSAASETREATSGLTDRNIVATTSVKAVSASQSYGSNSVATDAGRVDDGF